MILQQRVELQKAYMVQKPTGVPTQGLTIPGQGFNLKYAMEQYKRGSLVDRAVAFYEKEGLEMPDFRSMSRIEKLEALSHYRKERERLGELLINNEKRKADVLAKQEKAKQQESERVQRKSDSDGGKPDAK